MIPSAAKAQHEETELRPCGVLGSSSPAPMPFPVTLPGCCIAEMTKGRQETEGTNGGGDPHPPVSSLTKGLSVFRKPPQCQVMQQ